MNYIRQLDSIRAFAVLLVIISHWFPVTHALHIYTGILNGVDIFFVLSGFLITRILLDNRNEAEKTGTNKINVVKSFFTRRALRIFPVYYALILLLFLLGPATGSGIRSNFLYFVTYTSNFYFFKIQDWDGILSHFWSLAVEEQFYIVWPWFVLFLNRKYLFPFILASVLAGVAAQLYLQHVPLGVILTFSCLDALGLGALLAWVVVYKPLLLRKFYPILSVVALITFCLKITTIATQSDFHLFPFRTHTAICTVWIITGILLNGKKKSLFFNTILNNRPMVWMGKISYGIYLYHLPIVDPATYIFFRIDAHLPAIINRHIYYVLRLENFGLLILLSYLSWKLAEQPILRLKKYFEYQKPVISRYEKAPTG